MKNINNLRLVFLTLIGMMLYSCQNDLETNLKAEQALSDQLLEKF